MSRLRWKLTLSHMVAIGVTLASMIAAVLLLATTFWWNQAEANANSAPADDARAIANGVGGLLPDGAKLSEVLAMVASGDLRLASQPRYGPDAFHESARAGPVDMAYVVVVGPDGQVLASSDPSGPSFSPPERHDWMPLIQAAMRGETDANRLVLTRSDAVGPAALGAYPILDSSGQPVATALVAKTALPAPSSTWDFWQALLFFSAAIVAVLLLASVFAFASSSLVSFWLARRLVKRLETLGAAVEGFAAGDLSRRAEIEQDANSPDEVGELAQRFNAMAERLADTLAELEAEKRTVESALQAKRELVASVSHELRTPLASIRGHTESLLFSDDLRAREDTARTYLDVIHRQTEQLSHLIDDLFLLSTTDSGALQLAMRPVELEPVIDEVLSSIHPAAREERGVRMLSELDPHLPPVLADRQRVAQVLANLVRNAVRHTPEGGMVAVRAERLDSNHVVVSVEDTGEGISPDELERIFERFYRGEPSRDRASGGAGLGLAIVRELVTAMGGEVSAESVIGEGSRFAFTLRVASAFGGAEGETAHEVLLQRQVHQNGR